MAHISAGCGPSALHRRGAALPQILQHHLAAPVSHRGTAHGLPAGRLRQGARTSTHASKKDNGKQAEEPAPAALAKALIRDVLTGLNTAGSSSRASSSAAAAAAPPEDLRSPTYAIAAVCTVVCLLCALVPLLPASALLLNHKQPALWQLLTSCFAHTGLEALAQTVFFTYVFGRVVERNHGAVATWATYLSCGAAAAALAWYMLPAKAGLLSSAAPAAAWGLFLVGLALPRAASKPLEVLCLAPFACAATLSRYSHLSGALLQNGAPIGHLVHLAGASAAAALAALVLGVVERLREEAEQRRREAKRKADAASTEEAVTRVVNLATQAAQQLGKKLG